MNRDEFTLEFHECIWKEQTTKKHFASITSKQQGR